MKRFTPYQKLSKRKQREKDLESRHTWGPLSPVTRKPANSKAYTRKAKHPSIH